MCTIMVTPPTPTRVEGGGFAYNGGDFGTPQPPKNIRTPEEKKKMGHFAVCPEVVFIITKRQISR